MDQLAPNVYAFISNNTTHDWEDGNTSVIIGDDAVAVVDAPSTYLSKRHLAQIRKLTNKPIRYLINTHFHRDHVMGNHVYKDDYPALRHRLTATGWRIVNESPLAVLCFTDSSRDLDLVAIAAHVVADGRAWISVAQFEGRTVLRACITSHRTDTIHLNQLMGALDGARQKTAPLD